jgi:hypothetical protein
LITITYEIYKLIDTQQNCVYKKEEVDEKKVVKSSNIKYYELTVHHFFEKIINKDETVVMYLEIHSHQ